MRILLPILILFVLLGCKNDQKKEEFKIDTDTYLEEIVDSLRVSDKNLEQQQKTLTIKRQELIEKKDSKEELEKLLISKSFVKEGDWYTIDFKYPYLNEKIKPQFENFNEYITKSYLNAKGVEKEILEEKRLCDSLGCPKQDEKRLVDYKIYNLNDRLISVLFYKENYYTGAAHASYTFDCLNFDLVSATFMEYEDIFNNGSEEELRGILNDLLKEKINSGEMYYDCWAISADDFFNAKNNFVINDDVVEFYFDDCVICPSYTGTYSIQIPLKMLMPVLRNYKKNPLLG
ncbi:RsiV family protein [Aequorivita sp. CIP111184]|uniref:RsiV family protein n=1 Tax=Aequorivita sp. CIP111184 TaxID=2211356 RepID=UPI000DBC1881|nr:RsiV family protein [Aequorivita sp. CIP111184]SRX55161.1 Peptidoglycan-N-acetylmuramic acid deacetylase PdaC [Aequorivita sp. CIP111184]